jgi:hypothetical protein
MEREARMSFRPRRVFAYSLTFAFVIAMLLTGSSQKAIAGGTVNRLQSLELVGETSIGGIVDTSGTLVGDEVRASEDQSDTLDPLRSGANVPTPTAPIIPGGPNPTPQSRAATNPGLSGFNGLNHADQRNAGTGIYKNTQFSLEPPDQGLCVGRGFVMETINTALAVRKPDGTLLAGPTALSQFFGLQPEIDRAHGNKRGDFVSDPKCYYDQDTNRWFLTLLQEDPAPSVRTHTLIGVSKTGDPTGAWYNLRFDTTDDGLNGTPNHAGCPCLGDQPLIGADHYGFYVSTNEFVNTPTGPFLGVQLYAMSKWSLARGVLPTVVHIDDLGVLDGTDVSVQPATTPTHRGENDGDNNMDEESENGTEFFLSGQYAFNDQTLIAAWALTNTQSLSQATPNLTLHQSAMTTLQYSLPISVFQKDGPRPLGGAFSAPRISQNDFRMAQVVYAHGRLWASLGTRLQPTQANQGGRRDGILWFSVKPSLDDNKFKATLKGQAYVSLTNASLSYPSVGVNSRGQAIVAFSIVGRDEYPSVGYASIDEKKGTGDVHVAAAGAGPADGFTGYPPNGPIERWGDYSAAVADEDGNIWFAAEYISGAPRTVSANWATWIGKLTLPRGGKGDD